MTRLSITAARNSRFRSRLGTLDRCAWYLSAGLGVRGLLRVLRFSSLLPTEAVETLSYQIKENGHWWRPVKNFLQVLMVFAPRQETWLECQHSTHLKVQQSLFFLWKLKSFFQSSIGFFSYSTCLMKRVCSSSRPLGYYNNLPEKDKNIMKWVLYTYIKVTGTAPSDLQNLKQGDYLKAYSKVSTFLRDDKHIFWVEFRQLPSGRRIFVPICRTVRLLKSTVCDWIVIIYKYEEVC